MTLGGGSQANSGPQRAEIGDGRLSAPAAERNLLAVREALTPLLRGHRGLVLEVGSGTGQHAADWAAAFPHLAWQPSDPDPAHLASIDAWRRAVDLPNLRAPIRLDAAASWPDLGPLAGVVSLNVIHITPWPVAEGIVAGAGRALSPGGLLVFYGPFRENGRHTAESNARFDATLRARDPSWGVRDIDDLARLTGQAGFGPPDVAEMPANNRLLSFAKT